MSEDDAEDSGTRAPENDRILPNDRTPGSEWRTEAGGHYGSMGSHILQRGSSAHSECSGLSQNGRMSAVVDTALSEPFTSQESPAPTAADGDADTSNTGGRRASFYEQVKASLLEEVHEANDLDAFILDMQTTRALSLLPSDIIMAARAQSFYSDVSEEDEEFDALLMANESAVCSSTSSETPAHVLFSPSIIPIRAYVLLVSAVVGLSMIGPFLELLDGVHPALKMYWRLTATSLMLLPLAIWSVVSQGFPRFRSSLWGALLLTAASYSTFLGAFVVSLDYTSVGNATIYSNTHSLLLLVGKVLLGQHVTFLEGLGACVAFCGAMFCSLDSAGGERNHNSDGDGFYGSSVYGDMVALLSALGAVWYFVFAKMIRPHMSIYLFMFLNLFLSSQLVLFFIMVTQVDFTWDRHVTHGLFGWTNISWDRLGVQIAMTLIPDLFGAMGYIRSMHYFDTLIISVATLGEPVAAELTAFLFGVVGALPGILGWIGNVLVAGGTFAVIYPSSNTTTANNNIQKQKEQQLQDV